MEFEKELNKVRMKIIDAAILASMVLIFPALISSILRYFEIGWHYIYLVHFFSSILVVLLFYFRKRFSLLFKVHVFSTLLLIQSVAGLMSFRIAGISSMFIISATIPTLMFGRKQSVIYSLVYLFAFGLAGLFHIKGIIVSKIDFNSYSNNIFTWITFGVGSIFGLSIIIYSISSFLNVFSLHLKNSIKNANALGESYEKIKFHEERFVRFTDAFPYPVTIKDGEFKYIYGNTAFLKLTNIPLDQFIGKTQNEIYPPELSKDLDATDFKVKQSNHLVRKMLKGELNDQQLYYELIKFPLSDQDGNQLIGSITIDRTEQRKAEIKLVESEQTLRTLFTKAADGIALLAEERFIDCNQAVIDRLGYESKEDIIGKTPWDVSPEFQPDGVASYVKAQQMIQLCFQHGYHRFDWVHLAKDGEEVHYGIMLTLIVLNNKRLMHCVWRDVTEKHRALEALKESEIKYRSIFEGSVDGFVFTDKDQNIIECNESFCKLLKLKKKDLIQMSLTDLTPDKWKEIDAERLNNLLDKNDMNTNLFEKELIDGHGNFVPVELNMHRLELSDRLYFWAVIRDISERKNLEEANFSIMVSSEEKERARYAKELHDGLGPILSTSMIYLHTMRGENRKEKLTEYVDRTYQLIEDATESIREISNNLSPEILIKFGLVHAIRSFIEKLKQVSSIKFSIQTNLVDSLPETIEFTLYRTIIELINNSIKHANASNIQIEIYRHEHRLVVTFTDDGKGHDYEKNKNLNNGFGLINLEKRILKINGRFNYTSAIGKGIKVEIDLMLKGV